MDTFVLMSLGTTAVAVFGVAFLVFKIVQEERNKREEVAFVKAFSARHNKNGCPDCGCLPCQCGS